MEKKEKKIEMLNGVKIGESLSHGTFLNYDLFCAFSEALLGTDDWDDLQSRYPDVAHAARLACEQDYYNPWWDTNAATEVRELLEDTLDGYAPEGYYFGAHPGNGSDFGFWKCSD